MPINEILAPYYLLCQYTTWAASHVVRFYLPAGTVAGSGDYMTHTALVHPTYNPDGTVSQYVRIWFQSIYQDTNTQAPGIDTIAVWQSAPGPNTLIGYSKPIQPSGGSNQGVASSYVLLSGVAIAPPNRQKYKVMFFEAVTVSSPQRLSGNTFVNAGNQDVWAYLLGSTVTQDGLSPIIIRSTNIGYNRKLSRRYGRTLQP